MIYRDWLCDGFLNLSGYMLSCRCLLLLILSFYSGPDLCLFLWIHSLFKSTDSLFRKLREIRNSLKRLRQNRFPRFFIGGCSCNRKLSGRSFFLGLWCRLLFRLLCPLFCFLFQAFFFRHNKLLDLRTAPLQSRIKRNSRHLMLLPLGFFDLFLLLTLYFSVLPASLCLTLKRSSGVLHTF